MRLVGPACSSYLSVGWDEVGGACLLCVGWDEVGGACLL